MTQFHLAIHLGNAGMSDPRQIAQTLRDAAERIETTRLLDGNLTDINGNHVGTYTAI